MSADPHKWDTEDYRLPLVAEVHQAVGMAIGALDLPSRPAEAWLRAQAAEAGRGLVEVSRDIIERRLLITTQGLKPGPASD
jgi:hypothetical protein